jgi:N-acetylglucosamine-6-sulfatase
VPAGIKPRDLVLSIDLAPTLLTLAGLAPSPAIQGRSLLPILEHPGQNWRSSFLVEYYSDTVFPRIRNMGYAAVRTDRYKLIEYQELTGMDELYDLEADPFEEQNLIGSPSAADMLAQMRSELARLKTATGAPAKR